MASVAVVKVVGKEGGLLGNWPGRWELMLVLSYLYTPVCCAAWES